MQAIAAWLVARPQNAVLGLAASFFLPFAQIFSGAVMTLVTLNGGLRMALLTGVIAGGVLVTVGLITQVPVPETAMNAVTMWLPVALLAAVVRATRSLTLALQVSVILALAATLVFHAAVGDPEAFWLAVLAQAASVFSDAGLQEQADLLDSQRELIAPQMTALSVIAVWSLMVAVLAVGYWIFQFLPGCKAAYGRFCDLNFGRVLATAMAIGSLAALVVDWAWIENFAFVAFVIFWLQGLAIVHWLHVNGPLPILALVVIYVMLPVLNALLLMGLAVLGYTDAWFDFRSRAGNKEVR